MHVLKIIFIGIAVSFFFFTSQLQAQDATRAKQHFGVSLLPIGFGPNPWLASGATANIYLTGSLIMDLEYNSSGVESQGVLSSDHFTIKFKSYGAHLRYFLGNVFYVKLGADQRSADYLYEKGSVSPYTLLGSFKGESLTATLALGSEWQLQNFVLGCEWLGAAFPLSNKINEEYVSPTITTAELATFRNDQDSIQKKTVPLVLRLFIGFSF